MKKNKIVIIASFSHSLINFRGHLIKDLAKNNTVIALAPDKINNIEDKSDPYNMDLLNAYLSSLLRRHLNSKEYQVLRLSYGLDCEKQSAQAIADKLGLKGSSAFVRVSQLKRQAVDKLINNVDPEQVLDYM